MTLSATVLLTCVGGELSVPTINHLRRSTRMDMRVVGVDADARAIGRSWADEFQTVPMGDDPAYVDALLEICRATRVDVVIPGSDEEALTIAGNLERFTAEGIACSVPHPDVAPVLRNKGETFDLLRDRGVRLSDYARVSSVGSLRESARSLGYPDRPFIVKPAVARGGRGVWLVRSGGLRAADLWGRLGLDTVDLDALCRLLDDAPTMPELLLMPYLTGEVYDVDVLSGFGRCHYLIPRRRRNPRGVPFRGGTLEEAQAVRDLAHEIQRVLDLTCLYDLDIMLAADGTPGLLEVNPRLSASMVASHAAGVPLAEFLVLMLLHQEVPRLDIAFGARVRPYNELFVDYH